MKLAGRMSSKPKLFKGRHALNSALLGTNIATMGAFVTMAPGSPMIAAGALAANAFLSFVKGYTTTSAIGGADMRKSHSKHLTCMIANLNSRCHYCSKCVQWLRSSR